jgi:hypothetical protein
MPLREFFGREVMNHCKRILQRKAQERRRLLGKRPRDVDEDEPEEEKAAKRQKV